MLSPSRMLNLFLRPHPQYDCYSYIHFNGIPDGYEIVGDPYFDPCWHAFVFHIEHPSFDEIKLGDTPPIHDGEIIASYRYCHEHIRVT